MVKSKRPQSKQDINHTHPNAAAIDIGFRMHVVAVPIAMKSTSIYWIPAFGIFEQRGFEVVLVNAQDAKPVPGRKADVSNAQ